MRKLNTLSMEESKNLIGEARIRRKAKGRRTLENFNIDLEELHNEI